MTQAVKRGLGKIMSVCEIPGSCGEECEDDSFMGYSAL
jgi:hypothetical protein